MIQKMIALIALGALVFVLLIGRDADSSAAEPTMVTAAAQTDAANGEVMTSPLTSPLTSASRTGATTNILITEAEVAIPTAQPENWTNIALQGDTITVEGDGAAVEGSIVTITQAGTYSISGSLINGQIVVDTEDEDIVWLVLNGVQIHHETGAAIAILDANQAVVELAAGTENSLSDGATYQFADPEDDEPNAVLFSKADLTITGTGSLQVEANYNDGIASKDGLVITDGTIAIQAVDDGIRGKDYLVVQTGTISINAGGDGLKSDNEDDLEKGFIAIQDGILHITAGGDAIQAETSIGIIDGELVLTAGGGSTAMLADDASAKGIKAGTIIEISGGTYTIDTADDAIHTNGSLTISGGDFTLATGDDGLHADVSLTINAGTIRITDSYEGIESAVISINGGRIHLVASDDGINVSDDSTGGAMQRPPRGQQGSTTYTGSTYLYINGGYTVVDAGGDGIDVNGAIEMTDGVVIVNGPTMNMNGALDYDGYFNLTGGTLVAAGSSGMAQMPGASSTQPAVLVYFSSTQAAGTAVSVISSTGDPLFTFVPTKAFQSLVFSLPTLQTGTSYDIYLGGTAVTQATDGFAYGSGATGGTIYTSVSVNSVMTTVGTGGMNPRR